MRKKKKHDEILAEKHEKLLAERHGKARKEINYYQKEIDKKLRFQNDLGLEFSNENLNAGIEAVVKNETEIIKKFETGMKETFETF